MFSQHNGGKEDGFDKDLSELDSFKDAIDQLPSQSRLACYTQTNGWCESVEDVLISLYEDISNYKDAQVYFFDVELHTKKTNIAKKIHEILDTEMVKSVQAEYKKAIQVNTLAHIILFHELLTKASALNRKICKEYGKTDNGTLGKLLSDAASEINKIFNYQNLGFIDRKAREILSIVIRASLFEEKKRSLIENLGGEDEFIKFALAQHPIYSSDQLKLNKSLVNLLDQLKFFKFTTEDTGCDLVLIGQQEEDMVHMALDNYIPQVDKKKSDDFCDKFKKMCMEIEWLLALYSKPFLKVDAIADYAHKKCSLFFELQLLQENRLISYLSLYAKSKKNQLAGLDRIYHKDIVPLLDDAFDEDYHQVLQTYKNPLLRDYVSGYLDKKDLEKLIGGGWLKKINDFYNSLSYGENALSLCASNDFEEIKKRTEDGGVNDLAEEKSVAAWRHVAFYPDIRCIDRGFVEKIVALDLKEKTPQSFLSFYGEAKKPAEKLLFFWRLTDVEVEAVGKPGQRNVVNFKCK